LLDGTNHTDTVAQTVSRGSLIVGNSTPKWDELTIGANRTVLTSDGTDASWQPIGFIPPANPGPGYGWTPWSWFTDFDWKCDFTPPEVVASVLLLATGGGANSSTTATEAGHPGIYTHAASGAGDV